MTGETQTIIMCKHGYVKSQCHKCKDEPVASFKTSWDKTAPAPAGEDIERELRTYHANRGWGIFIRAADTIAALRAKIKELEAERDILREGLATVINEDAKQNPEP